jgi:hypothetical protein
MIDPLPPFRELANTFKVLTKFLSCNVSCRKLPLSKVGCDVRVASFHSACFVVSLNMTPYVNCFPLMNYALS